MSGKRKLGVYAGRWDSLRQKEERIEELEEALRESVQITAEREVVLAQEEHSRTHSEKQDSSKAHSGAEGGSEGKGLMDSTSDRRECVSLPGCQRRNEGMEMGNVDDLLVAMEKVKQELDVMKAKLSSTQLSLAEKEGHLTSLRAERRKHLEEHFFVFEGETECVCVCVCVSSGMSIHRPAASWRNVLTVQKIPLVSKIFCKSPF
ncbi:hypothetical protein F7725_021558 [Dissostichus mawsoni]|uniref:Uncharacterized protein n=1 Tax=Dissostichus mawsoni TaxID=36200 RepID=A0A7J5ZDS4_DISMA|nr:hypothetical protein F7725_021558 [Dissostichus mawsoni]